VPAPPVDAHTRVTVRVDPRATAAHVNGTRHDERPLELRLGREEAVEVEISAADGTSVRRTVRSRDDGILIALPAAPKKAQPRRPTAAPPKVEPQRNSPLLENPF
jgi:hypothetical protein